MEFDHDPTAGGTHLQRCRPGTVRLRPVTRVGGPPWVPIAPSGFQIGEAQLSPPARRHIIEVDGQIVGRVSTARADLRPGFEPNPSLGARQILSRVIPATDGNWCIKTGLWLSTGLADRIPERTWRRIVHRAGPLWGALMATRYGLQGYIAAIALDRATSFRPALSTAAFIQQVQAGAIDEPLLRAHLLYGARPVARCDETPVSLCIVRWQR